MRVRCPHCHNPIEVVEDDPLSKIDCPSCGSDFSLVATVETVAYDPHKPKTVGQFELVDHVGVGRFGNVWKARDRELDRLVALKMPRKGQLDADETEQFLREARAAAQIRHPNIVPVHEVGRSGDRIYIISDFIEGANLQAWLTGQKLTPRESAELCRTVAEALHAAHEAGVTHRDLKPGNILMDMEGQPHIADFGLAKREAGEITITVEGRVLGTPAYMPPEQARGEGHTADRRSDVYSLGVILFELLTGELPFRGEPRMLVVQVLRDDPPSLRRLNARIPRDLETICLRCMEKDPTRRYPTAQALADDLRCWLQGRPIAARPVSRSERAWRWCRRQPLVAGLSATVLLTLVTGVAVCSLLAIHASGEARNALVAQGLADKKAKEALIANARLNDRNEELATQYAKLEKAKEQIQGAEQRARSEKEIAEALNAFIRVDLLGHASPENTPERETKLRTVLDRAAASIGNRFQGQPLVEAAIRQTVGNTYLELGEIDAAEKHLARAYSLWREHVGDDYRETVTSMSDLATMMYQSGRLAEAIPLLESALETLRRITGEDDPLTASAFDNLAQVMNATGQYTEAATLYENALKIRERVFGEDHVVTARSYSNVALNLDSQGKHAKAQRHHAKALEIFRKALGEENPGSARAYNSLAGNLNAQGKYAEAEPLHLKALETLRNILGDEHPDTAYAYSNLASNLRTQSKHAEAEPLFVKALGILRKGLGEQHPSTARAYINLAGNLKAQGKYSEAGPLFLKALDIFRNALGDHPNTASAYINVADNLNAQGRHAEAELLFRKAIDISRKVLGEDHPATAGAYNSIADNLNAQQKYAEAEPLLRKALDIRRKWLGDEHPDTATSFHDIGQSLAGQCRYDEARPFFEKALAVRLSRLGEVHQETATTYHALGQSLAAQGNYIEALPILEKALELRRRVFGEQHPDTAASYTEITSNLSAQGQFEQAGPMLQLAVRSFESARLRLATRGLNRAFGAIRSPFALLASTEARAGHAIEAWRAIEADLARGLLDESSQRAGVTFTVAEEAEREGLLANLAQIEPQVLRLVTKASPTDAERAELVALLADRLRAEERLSEMAVAMSQRRLARLEDVQAALPEDAAFVAWVDVSDKGGGVQEHWGCVLRSIGHPAWVRLPGSGPHQVWTEDDTVLPQEFRQILAQPGTADEVQSLARRLAAQRIEPLVQHLKDVHRLIVVPVRAMAGIPVQVLTDQFTVSYVPSCTQLVQLNALERPSGELTMLAVGDPVYEAIGRHEPLPTAMPPGGLLITQVVPGGNADEAQMRAGDVLLSYANTELKSVAQLAPLIAAHEGDPSVTVSVWREAAEQPIKRQVESGKLGLMFAIEPAPEAITHRRESDLLVTFATRDWQALPGTRLEIARLAQLFPLGAVTTLAGSDASEQRLGELRDGGQLARFRYLHFATHGEAHPAMALESALILAQDQLSGVDDSARGAPFFDGRLTANEVLATWRLDCDLVTLSASESALGPDGGGEGFVGFTQALLLSGAQAVCLSLWHVDDTATLLLMDRFYQNLLGRRTDVDHQLSTADALREAQSWLRRLSSAEASECAAALRGSMPNGAEKPLVANEPAAPSGTIVDPDSRPYAQPFYWAGFILIGRTE